MAGWRKGARREVMASSTESGGRAGTVSIGFSTRLTRYASSRNATASNPLSASTNPPSTMTWPIAARCSATAARSMARPATTYSSRTAGSPTMVPRTGPAASPARMASLKTPAPVPTAWKSAIAACMSSAHWTARRATTGRVGRSYGNRTVSASPVSLTTLPPRVTARPIMRPK